jgi:hypothetical protein
MKTAGKAFVRRKVKFEVKGRAILPSLPEAKAAGSEVLLRRQKPTVPREKEGMMADWRQKSRRCPRDGKQVVVRLCASSQRNYQGMELIGLLILRMGPLLQQQEEVGEQQRPIQKSKRKGFQLRKKLAWRGVV